MANYLYKPPPAPTVLNKFEDPNAINLPPAYQNASENAYKQALGQYNNSFSAGHPVASKVMAALAGLAGGGILGAISAPMILNKAEDARHSSVVAGYKQTLDDLNKSYNQSLINQGLKDTHDAPINLGESLQAQQDSLRHAGMIGNETPDLYPRTLPPMDEAAYQAQNGHPWQQNRAPYMRPEDYNTLFKQAAGRSDIQALADNLPGFTQSGMSVTNKTSGKPGELQANSGSYSPTLPPIIVNPDALQAQLAAGYQTGLSQGTERYKFDQEAPKRLAEVQILLAQGKTEQAKALLTGAQIQTERQMPAKVRAETFATTERGKLERRTDPNIRSGGSSNDPLVGLGRMQEVLQRQKEAVLSQMQQNGFIDKTTGMIAPPDPKDAWSGVLGMGAHGSNANQVKQFNILRDQLNSIDNQLTGGSVPQQIYPPKPGNSSGKTRHNTSAGPVEY